MSYILDALRKSEQERRNQDQSVAFGGAVMTTPANEPKKTNPWVWVAVALIVSANVMGFLYFFKDDTKAHSSVTPTVGHSPNIETSGIAALEAKVSEEKTSNTVSSVDAPTPIGYSEAGVNGSDSRLQENNSNPNTSLPVTEIVVAVSKQVHQATDVQEITGLSIPAQYQSQVKQPVSLKHDSVIQNKERIRSTSSIGGSNISTSRVENEHRSAEPISEGLGFSYSEADVIRPKSKQPKQVASDNNEAKTAQSTLTERYNESIANTQFNRSQSVVNLSSQKDTSATPNLKERLLEGIAAPEVIKPSNSVSQQVEVASTHISQGAADRMPKIRDLSSQQQRLLPKLSFSGHLYSSRADARSIRMAGTKYKEGDWLTQTLQLVAVTEDGAVFDLQGSKFYMSSFDEWDGLQ